MKIAIQTADFDVSTELIQLRAAHCDIGAVVSFVGTVREMEGDGQLTQMELEHYPGMTEKSLQHIIQQALERWEIKDVVVIHRVGRLAGHEQIVLVAVASRHRAPAFEACQFIMDYLKIVAPFWKKEVTENGTQWVAVKDSDLDALDKWEKPMGEQQ